jgi:hypothetical protein
MKVIYDENTRKANRKTGKPELIYCLAAATIVGIASVILTCSILSFVNIKRQNLFNSTEIHYSTVSYTCTNVREEIIATLDGAENTVKYYTLENTADGSTTEKVLPDSTYKVGDTYSVAMAEIVTTDSESITDYNYDSVPESVFKISMENKARDSISKAVAKYQNTLIISANAILTILICAACFFYGFLFHSRAIWKFISAGALLELICCAAYVATTM